jgi:hypothetical protein
LSTSPVLELRQEVLRAGPRDVIIFFVPGDVDPEDMYCYQEIVEEISQANGATVALLPEDLFLSAKNYDLLELIELKEELEEVIQLLIAETTKGEA